MGIWVIVSLEYGTAFRGLTVWRVRREAVGRCEAAGGRTRSGQHVRDPSGAARRRLARRGADGSTERWCHFDGSLAFLLAGCSYFCGPVRRSAACHCRRREARTISSSPWTRKVSDCVSWFVAHAPVAVGGLQALEKAHIGRCSVLAGPNLNRQSSQPMEARWAALGVSAPGLAASLDSAGVQIDRHAGLADLEQAVAEGASAPDVVIWEPGSVASRSGSQRQRVPACGRCLSLLKRGFRTSGSPPPDSLSSLEALSQRRLARRCRDWRTARSGV